LRVVLNAAGIIALACFENCWNLRLTELGQSSKGKGEDLEGREGDWFRFILLNHSQWFFASFRFSNFHRGIETFKTIHKKLMKLKRFFGFLYQAWSTS
jgi:hypothetical protein